MKRLNVFQGDRLSRKAMLILTAIILSLFSVSVSAERNKYDRMAAWDYGLVQVNETNGHHFFMTYVGDTQFTHYYLAKFMFGAAVNGEEAGPEKIENLVVEDFPGGVNADFDLAGIHLNSKIFAAMEGRDTPGQDGAAGLIVKAESQADILMTVGPGTFVQAIFPHSKNPVVQTNNFDYTQGKTEIRDGRLILTAPDVPFVTVVRPVGDFKLSAVDDTSAQIRFRTAAAVMIGFGPDEKRAMELADIEPAAEKCRIDAYYQKLLSYHIDTPEKILNDAFRAALYNLEYNWVRPLGWIECINHWTAVWHQQHTAAAQWIGQSDRARECIFSQAERIENGQIPNINATGDPFYSFGGTNQYFTWSVRNYLKYTGDVEFARRIAPVIDEVLEGTFRREDTDNNMLFGWGLQIGNQEDFVATPSDGGTPTIEVINMMRTRAELADVLGETQTAETWRSRAAMSEFLLFDTLWIKSLGRLAFYRDMYGTLYPDGQYHTFTYPSVYEMADPKDRYTTLRHVRDRLMDKKGLVYCSNNFANHFPGTWGMQGGAAQQPWAAWGLANAGMCEDAWRPLKAISEYVMDENNRGSWPEVSTYWQPSYFSPPAGLFVQANIEGIFGLKVNVPLNVLRISPAFPSHWPEAELVLPDYSAKYERSGSTLRYTVTSKRPLNYSLRWKLPPAVVDGVRANGKELDYTVLPGVDYSELQSELVKDVRKVSYEIQLRPLNVSLEHPGSIAEGEPLAVTAKGVELLDVDDRCGVLSEVSIIDNQLHAKIQGGQVEPYNTYGVLGAMTFSRRTFFIRCRTEDGVEFDAPVDMTILPRVQAEPTEDIRPTDRGARAAFRLRNNTAGRIEGKALLRLIGQEFPFQVALKPRSVQDCHVDIPAELISLFSPGDNWGRIVLPTGEVTDIVLTARDALTNEKPLNDFVRSGFFSIDLSGQKKIKDTDWTQVMEIFGFPHIFAAWPKWNEPLAGFESKTSLAVPEIPGLEFELDGRNFIPVSERSQQKTLYIDLGEKLYRKIFLLVVPLANNHHLYTDLARITVTAKGLSDYYQASTIYSRTVRFPGDVDWMSPVTQGPGLGTLREPRDNRWILAPLLGEKDSDWSIARPPDFPQSIYWSRSVAVRTENCIMSVIEIDLGSVRKAQRLTIYVPGPYAGLALVSAMAYGLGDESLLKDTPWFPPAKYRGGKTVFSFRSPEDIKGWTLNHDAFRVGAVPGLFTEPTLNSLIAGENATGSARSPDFVLDPDYTTLEIQFQGGRSKAAHGPGTLTLELIDADTQEVLKKLPAPVSHSLLPKTISYKDLKGRRVYLQLTDQNTDNSFAWIGIGTVSLR